MATTSPLYVALKKVSPMELRVISAQWERECGYDSVETMEFNYDRKDTPQRAIICCFPRCEYALMDPCMMWFHVHFGPKHAKEQERAPYRLEYFKDLLLLKGIVDARPKETPRA